jgi:hypothetical protein
MNQKKKKKQTTEAPRVVIDVLGFSGTVLYLGQINKGNHHRTLLRLSEV